MIRYRIISPFLIKHANALAVRPIIGPDRGEISPGQFLELHGAIQKLDPAGFLRIDPGAVGESLTYVKAQMGHHSIQITMDLYAHMAPEGSKNAVDRLDDGNSKKPVAAKRNLSATT